MPMKSQAQRGYLHANMPSVAERFEAETPKGAHIPLHKLAKQRTKGVGSTNEQFASTQSKEFGADNRGSNTSGVYD